MSSAILGSEVACDRNFKVRRCVWQGIHRMIEVLTCVQPSASARAVFLSMRCRQSQSRV